MRARLEDSAKGWCYLATAQHSDRVDLQVYRDAWHSELLSTEDNVHKELLTVYCGKCTDDEGGVTEKYTKHWRRAQLGTDKDCLAAFNASEYAVDLQVYRDAWHSELLSTEDNVHKELLTVYCGKCTDDEGGVTEKYTKHWRRAQLGTDKDCLAAFNASEYAVQLREATKTAKLPNGLAGNLQDLRRAKCECIRKRGTAECDCKICSIFEKNLKTYHSRRHGWRNSLRKVGDELRRPEPCTCAICSNETLRRQFYEFSGSVFQATRVLHPCGKMEYEPYQLGDGKFHYYNGMCMAGKCGKRSAITTPWTQNAAVDVVSCGWDYVFGTTDCPLEATDNVYTWYEWRQQLRGTSAEGKP